MSIKLVEEENGFQKALKEAGSKLVVVYFCASWCKICQTIHPFISFLSRKLKNVVFVQIDVDKHLNLIESQGIYKLPSFCLYKNEERVEVIRGDNVTLLTLKIREHCRVTGGESSIKDISGLECITNARVRSIGNKIRTELQKHRQLTGTNIQLARGFIKHSITKTENALVEVRAFIDDIITNAIDETMSKRPSKKINPPPFKGNVKSKEAGLNAKFHSRETIKKKSNTNRPQLETINRKYNEIEDTSQTSKKEEIVPNIDPDATGSISKEFHGSEIYKSLTSDENKIKNKQKAGKRISIVEENIVQTSGTSRKSMRSVKDSSAIIFPKKISEYDSEDQIEINSTLKSYSTNEDVDNLTKDTSSNESIAVKKSSQSITWGENTVNNDSFYGTDINEGSKQSFSQNANVNKVSSNSIKGARNSKDILTQKTKANQKYSAVEVIVYNKAKKASVNKTTSKPKGSNLGFGKKISNEPQPKPPKSQTKIKPYAVHK